MKQQLPPEVAQCARHTDAAWTSLHQDRAENLRQTGLGAGDGARFFQATRIGIDTERVNVVGVLVGSQQVVPRWVNGEVSRVLPTRGFAADDLQLTRCTVYGADNQAIVSSVGAVEKLSVGMDVDIGRVAGAVKIFGQRRNGTGRGCVPASAS